MDLALKVKVMQNMKMERDCPRPEEKMGENEDGGDFATSQSPTDVYLDTQCLDTENVIFAYELDK